MARRRSISSKTASAGFTLIELLLVLSILALGISVVVLNAPGGRSAAQKDAEKFAAKTEAALQNAIMSGAAMRLEISAVEYRFLQYSAGDWVAVDGTNPSIFSRSTDINVELGDAVFANAQELNSDRKKKEADTVTLSLDPAGATTSATITFSDSAGAWVVNLSASGELELGRAGA